MTAFPMPAEETDGAPSPLGSLDSSPSLLRLPKYYQVKKHLLDFTAAMAPGSPVPPERELARLYGTSRTTVRQALAELVIEAGVLPPGIPVWAVDADAAFVRPGPRVVEGVETLAHIAHPDAVAAPPGMSVQVRGT